MSLNSKLKKRAVYSVSIIKTLKQKIRIHLKMAGNRSNNLRRVIVRLTLFKHGNTSNKIIKYANQLLNNNQLDFEVIKHSAKENIKINQNNEKTFDQRLHSTKEIKVVPPTEQEQHHAIQHLTDQEAAKEDLITLIKRQTIEKHKV